MYIYIHIYISISISIYDCICTCVLAITRSLNSSLRLNSYPPEPSAPLLPPPLPPLPLPPLLHPATVAPEAAVAKAAADSSPSPSVSRLGGAAAVGERIASRISSTGEPASGPRRWASAARPVANSSRCLAPARRMREFIKEVSSSTSESSLANRRYQVNTQQTHTHTTNTHIYQHTHARAHTHAHTVTSQHTTNTHTTNTYIEPADARVHKGGELVD